MVPRLSANQWQRGIITGYQERYPDVSVGRGGGGKSLTHSRCHKMTLSAPVDAPVFARLK